MTRAILTLGALLLAATGMSGQGRAPGSGRPEGRPNPRFEGSGGQERRGGENHGSRPGGPDNSPRGTDPAKALRRLVEMSPEKRERALGQLAPAEQERAKQVLEEFDRLPADARARRLAQLQAFANLPPARQEQLRVHIAQYNGLPAERQGALLHELAALQRMGKGELRARLKSEEFKSLFNPAERDILADLAANYPFIQASPADK